MRLTWIEPGVLAASGIPVSEADMVWLHDEGIRAIATLTEHPLTVLREITPELLNRLDIINYHAPIVDMQPPDIETAENVLRFIAEMTAQGRPTLIHCHAGIGRTGTMVHAYLLSKGLSLQQANIKVHHSRAVCRYIMLSDTQKAFLTEYADRLQNR